ncbi:MAG: M20 family metallo-hydrolase [Prevotella sp.]|nr:M20 family metallo-hydrolase [Prevotella sp.]
MNYQSYIDDAVELLRWLIATPSTSRNEQGAADIMVRTIENAGFKPQREGNNVWAVSPAFDERRPTVLLNAHLDTVRPVSTWTRNPYEPSLEGDMLYGLGSNDCGGGLVSLWQVFRILNDQTTKRPNDQTTKNERTVPFNLVYLASAEEEVTGKDGIVRALPLLPHIDVAIVGEPTGMQPAIAEKGLMVIDGIARGQSGHAARNEGVNAIYEALDDLVWLRDYRFERVSPLLGSTRMSVTVLNAGTQHNVVPDECRFVIDVRTNEYYRNEDVFEFLQQHVRSELRARSFRLHSSAIATDHPLVRRCIDMGMKPYGSPTLSDQSVMPFPSMKLGPGESARSHSADEFIRVSEIAEAIGTYVELLSHLKE